jgi:hypothetical protein
MCFIEINGPTSMTKEINNSRQKFFMCECSSHALSVTKFEDEDEFYFSIWHEAALERLSLLQRIRYIWKILKSGSPYGDQLILSSEKIESLINFLNKKKVR